MAIDPTPLLRINTLDLLMIWGDLVAAYYGRNGYGTDTAEIYAFRCADPGAAVRMRSDATQLADEGALAAARKPTTSKSADLGTTSSPTA